MPPWGVVKLLVLGRPRRVQRYPPPPQGERMSTCTSGLLSTYSSTFIPTRPWSRCCIFWKISRLKEGLSTTHPLRGDEIPAIKAWLAERATMKLETDAFFISERRSPLRGSYSFGTIITIISLLLVCYGNPVYRLGKRIEIGGKDPTFKGLWHPMTNFSISPIVSKTYRSVISCRPHNHTARRPHE